MNIKGLGIQNIFTAEQVSRTENREKLRYADTTDRDANGRREQGGQDEGPPTEEHVQKAIEYLKNHPGVKDNNLVVKRLQVDSKVVLVIEDLQGKVVRRIPDNQIRALSAIQPTDSTKGQIFHRAM